MIKSTFPRGPAFAALLCNCKTPDRLPNRETKVFERAKLFGKTLTGKILTSKSESGGNFLVTLWGYYSMVFCVCRSHVGQLPAAIYRERVRVRARPRTSSGITWPARADTGAILRRCAQLLSGLSARDTLYVFKKAQPNVLAVPSATKTGIRMYGHKKRGARVLAM